MNEAAPLQNRLKNERNSRMCPKILQKSLTGIKIGRDTRTWLEDRRKGLRGGIGTDGRRKAVKEIGREKRKNLMKQSKNRHWKEKDKERQSGNRAKMKSFRNQKQVA